ncbi:hypothetical protein BHAOGJBA_0689 [Methylobacterium hispanicum]|uniref:Uncharacterized protein n=1 Tax=Methylobacterium hispanicum TaxID=270350 RepID=A0AAV4ZGG6_9HYPH|nr:hypothetical protein [Methylobacterium hispanicum]GJD87189.1 hypothetical protein BHAOGJBA_0689 [Methylobacterium hispanicum]
MLSLLILVIAAAGVVAPVLLAAVAASRGAPEPAASVPAPIGAALPVAALGLTWRRHRAVLTGRGPRVLWLGEGDDVRYGRAYKLARETLRDVGFSWGTAESDNGVMQPVCWEDPAAPEAAMDYALAAADEALAEDDERLAAEAAQALRNADLDAALNGEARRADLAALRESLDTQLWAWGTRKRQVAEALLAEAPGAGGVPRSGAARLARDLVAEVEAGIAATRARAAEHPDQDWLTRADDPAVREAVHAAVRVLTALDEDQASVRNRSGWGQSHSRLGHVLAGLETLSVVEASHALAAVHRHRRQLPPDFRRAVFGTEA